MPYHTEYSKDGGVVTDYSGTVTDDDLVQSCKKRLSSDTRIRSYRYFLSDWTKVDGFEVTSRAIQLVAAMAVAASKVNKDMLLVAVLPTDLKFGIGRMWQAYADDDETGWKTIILRDRDEALEWLQKNLDSASGQPTIRAYGVGGCEAEAHATAEFIVRRRGRP